MTNSPPDLSRHTAPEGHSACRIPIVEDDGHIRLDPWWGTIQPCTLAEGVGTVGELEVIAHIERGGKVIDTRRREFVDRTGLIPTATHVEWEEINEHAEAFDADGPTVLYCNGPQCGATPNAVKLFLEAGGDPAKILYYRGGMQDWMGLGLPTVPSTES
jgi:rhodanese-related sulfurtransferase